jgi:hypothetical protein
MKMSVNDQFDLQIEDIDKQIVIKTSEDDLIFLKNEDKKLKMWINGQWHILDKNFIIK